MSATSIPSYFSDYPITEADTPRTTIIITYRDYG